MSWNVDQIGDLAGQTIIVTGANSGLGYETTKVLAGKGAKVIMACRNSNKAGVAADEIRKAVPSGNLEIRQLDLADLNSVKAFADQMRADYPHIDILINNAGLMALPESRTAQGFEMQVGTNHLGHFALTAQLFDLVEAAQKGRIVTVASQAHRPGKIDLDDLNWNSHSYQRWLAYAQAKLANLMFAIELGRRLSASNRVTISAAAHPGYASTELQAKGAKIEGASFKEQMMELGNRIFAHSAYDGALPSLLAATDPSVQNGDYFGPKGFLEMQGAPIKVKGKKLAYDEQIADGLWDLSEELTGVKFAV